MSPRLAILLLILLGALFLLYLKNPDGWAKTVTDLSAAVQSAPGASWSKVVTDAKAAVRPPPDPEDGDTNAAPETAAPTNAAPAGASPPGSVPLLGMTTNAPANPGAAPASAAPPPVQTFTVANRSIPLPGVPPADWTAFATSGVVAPAAPGTNASASVAPGAVANPAPSAPKPWAAPEPLPAQPHWIWATSDGQEYDDVVVTKVEPETVAITHSRGAAQVEIAKLPPEIQKELNYDPAAAAAAKKEADREAEHPYYRLASLDEAKAAARELHWPLAWVCSFLPALSDTNAATNSDNELTQMVVSDLKSQAVVIFVDGGEVGQVAPIVHEQFFLVDDGPIPGGHHFYVPKIVFSDADVTKALGRVSHTQLKTNREAAIYDALAAIAAGKFTSPTPVGQ